MERVQWVKPDTHFPLPRDFLCLWGRRPGKERDGGWACGRHKGRGNECDSERDGGTAEREEGRSNPWTALGVAGEPDRSAALAGARAHLERPRHSANTRAERAQVDVLGCHQRLQREALQDGGEEEEELHARQRLAQAHSASS